MKIDEETIQQIHVKSQGLPLYLRYVTTWLAEHANDITSLGVMPEAGHGDIRDYYERLWSNLEREGMGHARYLSGVLAALRFPVHEEELVDFQDAIPLPDAPPTIRAVAHLLRRLEGQISIFHDSFRFFVNGKLDEPTRQCIARRISIKLKAERGSSRWFSFAFRYALEAGDGEYVLAEVNRPFVDFALQHCWPASDILAAIDTAARAAVLRKDLVALARLGSLHFRTNERLEQFDYSALAKVQLALGRVGDVLAFCCRQQERRWLVDDNVAMQVMVWCAGEKLMETILLGETRTERSSEDIRKEKHLKRVMLIERVCKDFCSDVSQLAKAGIFSQ